MNDRPVCTILAGPNGSGKTSLFEMLQPPGEQVNADRVARALAYADRGSANRAAGQAVIARLKQLIASGSSFNYETTLSSRQSVNTIIAARQYGFTVALNFVVLPSPMLNVARVKERVAKGGHDIPAADIIRRYDRAFENLPEAFSLSDEVRIYDNGGREFHEVFSLVGDRVQTFDLKDGNRLHRRLKALIKRGHEMRTEMRTEMRASSEYLDANDNSSTFTPKPPRQ